MSLPFSGRSDAVRATPWAIAACLLWALAFPLVKIGLEHMPPLTFAGVRFILAGCLLLPAVGRPKAVRFLLRRHGLLVLKVSFLQTILLYAAFFWGMSLVRGAQGAVLCGASPLAAALVAHWLMPDDRMTLPKAATIALGMVGVVILAAATKPWSPTGLKELGGLGLLSIGVLSSSLAGVLVARTRHKVNAVLLASLQMLFGGAVLLAVGLAVHGLPRSVPPASFFGVLLCLAFISAAGFSIWFYWLKRVKVSRLNMWKFIMPLFGTLLSWLLVTGESPDWPTAGGMVCVALAVLLNQAQAAREDQLALAA